MRFRITTIAYAIALLAAAMATFGAWGIVWASMLLGFWSWILKAQNPAARLGTTLASCLVVIILAAIVLPSVSRATELARRNQCANNMKQLALALSNYESSHLRFPAASTFDANDSPLHSWRTLALPYIEAKTIYHSLDLAQPWNSPSNSKQFRKSRYFQCPSHDASPSSTYLCDCRRAHCLGAKPRAKHR